MHRTALAVLFMLTTPAAAQVTGSLGAASPTLKRHVTVTSEIVRIGDMIENAGAASQIAIFRAPDLGTSGTVSTTAVLQAARVHLVGIDTAGISDVLVTRSSRAITSKDVEARIAEAIAQQLRLSGDSEITAKLDRDMRTLHVEASATTQLQIARLAFDPRSGQFDAILEVPGSTAARRHPLRFSGRAMETVEIAALARPLARGEIMRASDIIIERRPKAEAGADFTSDMGQIVGMASRRAMRAGQILRPSDLMRPELVQRNENVTLVFEAPGIMLTSRAKALESGAEGDLISVLNVQSKRTVQGIVTGPSTVTVSTMKPRIASAAPATQASRTE
jgi:flagellar basal body P-ring formation protein FlgA